MQDEMKTILRMPFVRLTSLVSLLCVLCASLVNSPAQDFKTLKDGIEYAGVTHEFTGKAVNINLLRLDPKKVRLDVHHARDSAIGTEKTSSIAIRHGAFAAINAGFFRLDTSHFAGEASGLLMIDGKLLSEPANGRIQLLINNKPGLTDIVMARTLLSQTVKIAGESFEVAGINRERKNDELVIYSPEFGPTTLTGDGGIELVVTRGNVASIINDLGNSVIPPNGYVISASGSFRESLSAAFKGAGTVVLNRQWDGVPSGFLKDRARLDIVAGVPQLIKNGTIDITWEQEKSSKAFVETRHPRTAVAKLKNGKFLMVTVDGRSEASAGIDLYDLAAYLLELGATDAMNLDGGGSTTMFVDGKVVNKPSDKEGERKVSDAILVTPRAKSKK